MADINDKVFDEMESVAADKTFVDLFKGAAIESTTETEEDKKNWKNFEKNLGSSIPTLQKQQLKALWIQGGRPTINIKKKDTKGFKGHENRASFDSWSWPTEETRDVVHIFEHQLVSDFMAEIAHGIQYARLPGESIDDWRVRRQKKQERSWESRERFGEDVYGGKDWDVNLGLENKGRIKKWFPYQGQSRLYSIGIDEEGNEVTVDDEGNIYPDIPVPQTERYGPNKSSTSRTTAWVYPQQMRAVYDPERRKGYNKQRDMWIKPTIEFEAHSIIEDSLWEDYESRFGSEWTKRMVHEHEGELTQHAGEQNIDNIDKLIQEGYLE
jgi:hypothetical protein